MTSTKLDTPPLHGLVLAGGRSTRMKQDKALLKRHGITLVEQAYALLATSLPQTYISCRKNQWPKTTLPNYPKLHDLNEDLGPMGGLLSAIKKNPNAAWFVIACDTPLLDHTTIQQLINQRASNKHATAYRSPHHDAPEPLCAIYEPSIHNLLHQHQNTGSLRDLLREANTHLLAPPNNNALYNINTPEAFDNIP